jgi:sec-independent protein translocase protein TatB
MLEINIWKLLLVLIIAIIVLGPNHLPGAARMLGRFFAKIRHFMAVLQKDIDSLSKSKPNPNQKKLTQEQDQTELK